MGSDANAMRPLPRTGVMPQRPTVKPPTTKPAALVKAETLDEVTQGGELSINDQLKKKLFSAITKTLAGNMEAEKLTAITEAVKAHVSLK